jgi:hypothetical protein
MGYELTAQLDDDSCEERWLPGIDINMREGQKILTLE